MVPGGRGEGLTIEDKDMEVIKVLIVIVVCVVVAVVSAAFLTDCFDYDEDNHDDF